MAETFLPFINEPSGGGQGAGLQNIEEAVIALAVSLPAGNVLDITSGTGDTIALRNPLDKYTMIYLNGSLMVDDDYTRISNTQLTFADTLSAKAIVKVRQYVL